MFSAGNDDEDPYSDPYGSIDVDKSLKAQKSAASKEKKRAEKKARDAELQKKREDLARRRSMTEEERIANILKSADSEVKPTASTTTSKKKDAKASTGTSDFADYAKSLEKLRMGDNEDDAVSSSGENRMSTDAMGNTDGTAGLDGTGMVRFGSMDGPASMIQKNADETNDTKDDSLQAFLDEDSDSDADSPSKKFGATNKSNISATSEESEEPYQYKPQLHKSSTQPMASAAASKTTTPIQSTRNSVDTTMSTPPPPPPDSTNTSAMSSAVPSPAPAPSPPIKTADSTATDKSMSPPPTYQSNASVGSSNPGPANSKSLTSQHSQLQESVENLYKSSTPNYSRSGPEKGQTTSYTSEQLSTADTLGAAALQLEKERATLREQRTRLQNRELDLARAKESFASSVRMSQEFDSSKNEPATTIKKLQATIDDLTKERESMILELDDVRSECYDLRKEVEAAKNKEAADKRSNRAEIDKAIANSSGNTVTIPKAEVESYKKQLEQQENLLNGFQKENDKLVLELKKKSEEFKREKGEILKERESLNLKANKWENSFKSVRDSHQNMVEMRQNLRTTLDNEKLLSELKEELAVALEKGKAAEERNVEMKFEMDKLRKEKKEKMLASEGLSAEKLEAEERDTAVLKELVRRERTMHQSEIERLQAKLRWYIQNQEMVDRDASILEEQNKTITTLKARLEGKSDDVRLTLEKADSEHQQVRSASNENKKTAKKIRDLERQVKELEETLKRRHPDSISNLIRAMGPSESVEVRNKESKIETRRLKEEVDEIKQDSERRLRSLRQEYDKMKLGFEGQIKQLRKDVSQNKKDIGSGNVGGGSSGGHSSSSNNTSMTAKDSDTVERLRQYYTKKIQDQEKKFEAQLRQAKRGNVGQPSVPKPSSDKNVNYERVQELEQLVSKQREMLKMMEGASMTRTSADSQRSRDLEGRLGVMEGRVKAAEREAEGLKVNLAAAEARLEATVRLSEEQSKVMTVAAVAKATLESNSRNNSAVNSPAASMEGKAFLMQQQQQQQQFVQPPASINTALHDAEMKKMQVEMEVKKREYQAQINDLQKRLIESNSEVGKVQQKLYAQQSDLQGKGMLEKQEMMEQQQRLELAMQSAQMNAAMLKNQVDTLKQENGEINRRLSLVMSNPTISQFGDLAQRLQDLERRGASRQEELEETIRRTKENTKKEARRMAELHQEEIMEKDRQVRFMKRQLDEILGQVRKLSGARGASISTY